jgi:hypothetical protein
MPTVIRRLPYFDVETRVPSPGGDVAVYREQNIPGKRDPSPTSRPICLELDGGIGVCPTASQFPRIPLLGLRSLQSVDARLTINCKTRMVTIGIPIVRR